VGCVAGTPPQLEDGFLCTIDACDEQNDTVTHAPDDTVCNDGQFCNGEETCAADAGCQAGQAPVVSDGVDCTVDSCSEEQDQVLHVPNDALCDDGNKCNGVETCDPDTGCVQGQQVDCYFDLPNDKILLDNNIFIKCFGGLTVSDTTVSCPFPLFNTDQYSTNPDNNIMLGLHNEGEQYSGGHKYILEQIGAYIGYAGSRQVKHNEPGPDNVWQHTGTHANEHCYHQGQLLNWKQNAVCHNGFNGGNNVLSSFKLFK